MFRPRVLPVLLLKGKGLVKTVKFNKKNATYIGDPINAVRIFNDLKADELVFLDITATIENRTISYDLVKDIGDEAYMPFAAGGGIRTVEQAVSLIASGAEKVVLNSSAVSNPDLIRNIAATIGNQSLVVCIDIKRTLSGKYQYYVLGGLKKVEGDPVQHAREIQERGAGEIIVNCINRDGMMSGYDIKIIKQIADAINIPVVACGGAGNLEHFKEAFYLGNAHALAAGSMFVFHGARRAVLVNYPTRTELLNLFCNRENNYENKTRLPDRNMLIINKIKRDIHDQGV
ncbi:MAG: imidazole glycerol phosphate synthase subunit HisF [Candidatus Atribacteria bacterium]|nr:imidazole glycerol phosphate synthase subunit HisF [Candidatus Atribacteria bacterium]